MAASLRMARCGRSSTAARTSLGGKGGDQGEDGAGFSRGLLTMRRGDGEPSQPPRKTHWWRTNRNAAVYERNGATQSRRTTLLPGPMELSGNASKPGGQISQARARASRGAEDEEASGGAQSPNQSSLGHGTVPAGRPGQRNKRRWRRRGQLRRRRDRKGGGRT